MTVVPAGELLGRRAELEAIAETVESVGDGEGRLLVIEGQAGIGKTSLLTAARHAGRARELRVLTARAGELERDFAFGVVRQLFEPALFAADDGQRAVWLGGAAGFAAPVFDPAEAGRTAPDTGFQRRHGLFWLASNLAADRGLLLLVDDVHWADAASLDFLAFLTRRLEDLPLGLVVAGRPRRDGFGGLTVDPAARVLRPDPLEADDVARLVAAALPTPADPVFAEACRSATGGVPLLLRELLRAIRAESIAPEAAQAPRVAALSPSTVTTAIALRLARLPPAAVSLARAVAVLSDGADAGAAAELAGIPEADAPAMAAILADAEVLEADAALRFVHPIVRTAVYEDTAPAERPQLHAQAARVLHARMAPDEAVAAQLGLASALGEPWAIELLRRAATRALSLGAPAVAAAHLRRALAEARDPANREPLLVELALAETTAGKPEAVEHLVEAAALAEGPRRRAEIALERSRLLRFLGRGLEAVEIVERAAAELGDQDGELAAQLELELLATASMSTAALRRLGPLRERVHDSGQPPRDQAERFRLALLAFDTALSGSSAAAASERARRAVGDRPAYLLGSLLDGHSLSLAALALTYADRLTDAMELTVAVVEFANRLGNVGIYASMLAQRALIHFRRGALAEAEADAVLALQLGREVPTSPALHSRAAGALTYVAVERGAQPDPELLAAATDTDATASRSLAYSRAELLLAEGQYAAAVTALEAIGRFDRDLGWEGPAQYPWRSQAAVALAALGEHERARALAADELERARSYGAARPIGIALRATSRLTPPADRIGLLVESVAALASSGAELEHARSLVDLGTALRVAGRRREAREPLRSGYELARRCSATRLAEHAWRELVAAGARPRRRELQGAAALTASERRIAELAAAGASNREIAQSLFVTLKTVETHLGRAYAKLGISSRTELPTTLAG